MNKFNIAISTVSFLALGLINPVATFALGPAAINLGSIGTNNFVILGQTGITDVPSSVITGNVGNSPGTGAQIGVTCGEITGSIYTVDALAAFAGGPGGSVNNTCVMAGPGANKTLVDNAVADMGTAYTNASAPVTPAGVGPNLNIGTPAGTVGTMTLAPGVYTWGSNVTITNDVTLSGSANDVWVFQISGTLDLAANKKIILSGGAQAKNIFWQVSSTVNLLAGSHMEGIILSQTNIAMVTGATLNGRALAQTAVALDHNTISISSPVAAVTPVVHRRPAPIVPIIDLVKVPSPLALTSGQGQVTYNYTVKNIGGQQPLIDITLVDDKCSPIVLSSGDLNNDRILDVNESWKYTCTATLNKTTTNTAIVTGHSSDGYYQTAIDTAIATVIVSTPAQAPVQAPLINITKVPNQLTPFPYGGGNVTYTYTVTNPGVVAMNNVKVTDDKCSTVSFVSGDNNANGLLDVNESWVYSCKTSVQVSTGSVAAAKGDANGFTAMAYAFTNVLVSVPDLPNTAFGPQTGTSWTTIVLSGIIIVLAVSLFMVMRKRNNLV